MLVRSTMKSILLLAVVSGGLVVNRDLAAANAALGHCNGVNILELTIAETRALYRDGKLTPFQLTECYLARIRTMNPVLRAVLEEDAHALDVARQMSGCSKALVTKPLCGIPVLVKGSCAVDGLSASGGAAALHDNRRGDADVVKKLREAGAIILGTTNLSELSGMRALDAPEGWSELGGQTLNPYHLNETTLGSSSGSAVAVAANLALVSFGTATFGSVISPASRALVVGFKPTYNWTSTHGNLPVAPFLDTVTRHATVANLQVGIFSRSVQDSQIAFAALANHPPKCPPTLPKKVTIQ